MVYGVVWEGVIECSNTLEDEHDPELLPQALVYKPCRQLIYGLLLLDGNDGGISNLQDDTRTHRILITISMLFRKRILSAICICLIFKWTYHKFCKPVYKSCSFTRPRYLSFVVYQPLDNRRIYPRMLCKQNISIYLAVLVVLSY